MDVVCLDCYCRAGPRGSQLHDSFFVFALVRRGSIFIRPHSHSFTRTLPATTVISKSNQSTFCWGDWISGRVQTVFFSRCSRTCTLARFAVYTHFLEIYCAIQGSCRPTAEHGVPASAGWVRSCDGWSSLMVHAGGQKKYWSREFIIPLLSTILKDNTLEIPIMKSECVVDDHLNWKAL